ncbi:hypothetical protein B0H14DRAFT_3168157 [Mycena olivaceomarginata]|nr:hypothetical protein B0H14DRAFT_3168157 [Mycena olivaceomarginata]
MFSRDKTQIGSLDLPGNWDPELEPACDHPLAAVLNSTHTLRQLVSILSTFSEDHPIILQYQLFCEKHNPDDHGFAHHTSWWIQSLSLEPTPEAVSLINETLEKMDNMRPQNIGRMHWKDHVGAVGRGILYLAIQYELGEVFDLSGQTLLDILNGSISPLNQDWRNVFFFMYLATDPEELRHKDTFHMDTFTANRNSFYSEHVIYNPTIRLPKFECLYPSCNTGMTPISITVMDAADAEFHRKRKGNNEQAESLRPAKRNHKIENGGVMRKIKDREQRSQGSFNRENREAAV